MAFIRSLDPKLVSTVLTFLLTQAVLKLGFDLDDVLIEGYLSWAAAVSLVAGAIVGYVWPNDGSVLRRQQEDGNANRPV